MVMPVFLEIEFTNGEKMDYNLPVYVWYYTNLWTTDVAIGDREIKRVIIDRKRVMPDLNRRNNNWVAPDPEKSGVESVEDSAKRTEAGDANDSDTTDGDGGG